MATDDACGWLQRVCAEAESNVVTESGLLVFQLPKKAFAEKPHRIWDDFDKSIVRQNVEEYWSVDLFCEIIVSNNIII